MKLEDLFTLIDPNLIHGSKGKYTVGTATIDCTSDIICTHYWTAKLSEIDGVYLDDSGTWLLLQCHGMALILDIDKA